MCCPVMYEAASESKQHTGLTASSGAAQRPIGIRANMPSRNLSPLIVSIMGVSTTPKHTEFVRTRNFDHSLAADIVMPSRPLFAADLADRTGSSSVRRDINDRSWTFVTSLPLRKHDATYRLGPQKRTGQMDRDDLTPLLQVIFSIMAGLVMPALSTRP